MRAGDTQVASEMLGIVLNRMYCSCDVAAASRDFPHVTKLLCQFIRDNPPAGLQSGESFPFSTICINRGIAYYTILYYTILYYTILYYTIL